MRSPILSEYLSKDILEEDFIKVFSFFVKIQNIMGASRVDARDRFVTAPSIYQKVYTIIYVVFTIFIGYFGFTFYGKPYIPYPRLYYLAASGIAVMVSPSLFNAIHVRFLNKDDNIAFYIKMQEIDRIMDISQCKPINTMLATIHYHILSFWVGTTMLFIFVSVYEAKVIGVVIAISLMSSFLEIAYCSNLAIYFLVRVRFINGIMFNHIHTEPVRVYTTSKLRAPSNSNLTFIASQSHNFLTSDTDIYLKNIFECFLKYQHLYRFQVKLNCLN